MKTYLYEIIDDRGSVVYWVSLLPPVDAFAGGIPDEGLAGRLTDGPEHFDESHFVPNARFMELMHQVIAKEGRLAPLLIAAARKRDAGWIYLIDERTPDPDGEVPPVDIVGAFEVNGGRIIGYRPSPEYRFLTEDGTPRLDEWVYNALLAAVTRLAVDA